MGEPALEQYTFIVNDDGSCSLSQESPQNNNVAPSVPATTTVVVTDPQAGPSNIPVGGTTEANVAEPRAGPSSQKTVSDCHQNVIKL